MTRLLRSFNSAVQRVISSRRRDAQLPPLPLLLLFVLLGGMFAGSSEATAVLRSYPASIGYTGIGGYPAYGYGNGYGNGYGYGSPYASTQYYGNPYYGSGRPIYRPRPYYYPYY